MPTWTPKLAIGVPAIDSQHKELFARADALLTAMSEGKTAQEVKPLLAFLDDYCSRHFTSEERLMREKKYPGLHEHVSQHAVFVKQFQGIMEQFHAKGPSITVSLGIQKLVSSWLVQHIGAVDAKLASFLANQSVSMTI
jgi:hemerythrin